MHSSIFAFVLCILAQSVGAQCVSTAETGKPATLVAPQAAAPRIGGELITTAAASTRDAPVARATTPAQRTTDEDHPGGTGMLLAALALMSGIALRRYGSNSQ